MSNIFISYSSKDVDIAIQIADDLIRHGCDVWIDRRGIDGGTKWASEISRAIRNCTYFLIILSRNSLASDNVRKEVELAAEDKKAFVPVRLEEAISIPDDFRYHLAGIQHVGMFANYQNGLNSLLKIIGSNKTTTTQPNNKIIVETRAWNKGHGDILSFDYTEFDNIADFLDAIFYSLTIQPPHAYTFGKTWALLDTKTGFIFRDMGTAWAWTQRQERDLRSLEEAGILPNMSLLVIPL